MLVGGGNYKSSAANIFAVGIIVLWTALLCIAVFVKISLFYGCDIISVFNAFLI